MNFKVKKCFECNGDGVLQYNNLIAIKCPICNGSGEETIKNKLDKWVFSGQAKKRYKRSFFKG